MAAPKFKTSDYSRLYKGKEEDNLRDKQKIEALKERLNDMLVKNPENAKKAALVIEQWLKKKH